MQRLSTALSPWTERGTNKLHVPSLVKTMSSCKRRGRKSEGGMEEGGKRHEGYRRGYRRGEREKRNGLDDCCSLQRNSIQVERALRSLAFNWEPRGEKGRGRGREGGRVSYLPLQTAHRNDRSTGSFKYFNNLLYREWRFEYLAVPRYAQDGGEYAPFVARNMYETRDCEAIEASWDRIVVERESLFSRKNFVEQLSRY